MTFDFLLFAVLACFFPSQARAAGSDSRYLSLVQNVRISASNQTLLKANISGGQSVFLCVDGIFLPLNGGLANAFITVDGQKVSNDALINWTGSLRPVAHSFRAISILQLAPGTHEVALVANGSGSFVVGAGANLAIMTQPSTAFLSRVLKDDSRIVAVNTRPLKNGVDALPYLSIADATVDSVAGQPVIAMGAGRSYYAGTGDKGNGDAMWGLWLDGDEALATDATYADNDMFAGAEFQAPMFVQAFLNLPQGTRTVTLGASAEPWPAELGADEVRYRVGAGSRLLIFQGGMKVAGHSVAIDQSRESLHYNRFPYQCIGSSSGWTGCPDVGEDVTISSATIFVPTGHNGVIFLSSMTRVQGDRRDQGGTFEMWLTVDGSKAGSVGMQQLAFPSAISTRTVSSSYLATGDKALRPGEHKVELHVRATGRFIHLSITRNMPMVWFD